MNGGDSLVTEVPEYSGVLSTLGDSPAPNVAKPEFRGGVNSSVAEIHHLSDFTGGVNGGDSLVTEVPEYSGVISTLGDSPAPTVAKPEYMGDTLSSSGEESAPTVEQYAFTGGVNGDDSLVTEVPEYSGVLSTLGDSPAPTVAKPDFRGGVNGAETAVHEIPRYKGGTNVADVAVHEFAEYKGADSPVTLAQQILPGTGEKENVVLTSLGLIGFFLGLFAMGKKRE